LENGFRRRIGLLALDAPVFELVEGDWLPGNRASHIGARLDEPEIGIEILDDRFATAPLDLVHGCLTPVGVPIASWRGNTPEVPLVSTTNARGLK
jgi:hypothetical protein